MQFAEIKTGTRLEVAFFRAGTNNNAQEMASAGSAMAISPRATLASANNSAQEMAPAGSAMAISLRAKLLEPARGREMLIAVPIRNFRHITWPDGFFLLVSFCQQGSCLWTFSARLLEQTEADGIRAFRIQALDDLTRQQRREWYRLPISLDMTFRLLPENPDETSPASEALFPAVTRDISGGGAAIITSGPIPDDCEVELTINLDQHHPIQARGRVIRANETEPGPGRHRQQISLQFTEISQSQQDALAQFIFRQQLKQRR